jgi:hypothetical protein
MRLDPERMIGQRKTNLDKKRDKKRGLAPFRENKG